ncbi:MAG: hypothetical protein ACXACY_28975 [Candidatus Hodarchaeales archaeon]|jgi:hypothetical protein
MQYEIGFFIPSRLGKIKKWKNLLENEIRIIDGIIEKLELPNVYSSSIEAASAAQLIKDHMGVTNIITEISVEPIKQ